MKGSEILRIVDAIHRDKNVDKEIVFEGIEQAILSAARKHFGEEAVIEVSIDRQSGDAAVSVAGDALKPDEIGDLLGRIAAQTAKQVMIQKIREAERDSLFDEYTSLRGQIVTGQVSRIEGGGTALVSLGKVEGILPRGEQIPGEAHHVGERVRSVVMDVRKAGSRVKIILSRTHPELVRRLFELEIPEVAEHVIEVRSLAREAGYRSKVAVSCYDTKIDCVGACVGVRGSRIRSVVDELAGERIDIVRWNDSLQVLVPNALQPAEVEDVILCPQLGKVIVLVREDQLSLAIGKKGQNVRLASKLVGWDIQVLTQERLDEQIERSLAAFANIPNITADLSENLVAQGFFTFDELSVIEPDQLAELGGLTPEQCDEIVAYADEMALKAEEQDRADRERRRVADAAPKVVAEVEEVEQEEDADQGEADSGEASAGEPDEVGEGGVEPSAGPHDETESGDDPDGSGVVEHLLASGAEVDPKSAVGGSGE
ncbi:MAG: transcription termination factor NusA [Planctomycetota bacterium]|nr:transcription termination factor NusA [Planctomycetaceae bacterium]MDQ3332291.1 transcription termination factor NusA [Planctomycetota bacterium]